MIFWLACAVALPVLPAPVALPVLPAPPAGTPQCDVSTEGAICLGSHLILPKAVQPGVVGYWPFDHGLLDQSGRGNHGAPAQFEAAPSLFGVSMRVPAAAVPIGLGPGFDTPDFTYQFWVLVQRQPPDVVAGGNCTLLAKGAATAGAGSASPRVQLDVATRQLTVALTTTSGDETLASFARLRYGQWYHVSVVRLGAARHLRLYVNGLLDAEVATEGYTEANAAALSFGPCPSELLLDEVRAFDRAVPVEEIEVAAALALGGVEAAYVRVGCGFCSLDEAMQSCPESYHICTSIELHTTAYAVGRSLGWVTKDTHVWTHATDANAQAQTQAGVGPGSVLIQATKGLGLCCLDS